MNVSAISNTEVAAASLASKQQTSQDLQVKMLKQAAKSQEMVLQLLASVELGQQVDIYA